MKSRLADWILDDLCLKTASKKGEKKPDTFNNFLGVTHYYTRLVRRYLQSEGKPIFERMMRSLKAVKETL